MMFKPDQRDNTGIAIRFRMINKPVKSDKIFQGKFHKDIKEKNFDFLKEKNWFNR